MKDIDWINRLGKWRTVFTGWQLGTRAKGDPEADAVRDHRELTSQLRAEINTLTVLLIEKKVFTVEEMTAQVHIEAEYLCKAYEQKFPGCKATDTGLVMDAHIWKDTTAGWRP